MKCVFCKLDVPSEESAKDVIINAHRNCLQRNQKQSVDKNYKGRKFPAKH